MGAVVNRLDQTQTEELALRAGKDKKEGARLKRLAKEIDPDVAGWYVILVM